MNTSWGMDEKRLIVYPKMNEIVSLILILFLTPLSGFSPFSWWPLYFSVFLWLLIFWWLLYYDIFISNMYVHFHHRFFIAHVLFNVGVFVICMLPLPYSPNYSFYLFYFAIFLQDHCHVAFNPTSIFDRSKLYPTLIYSNCPSLWQNELYKVHDQAWCVHIT